MTPPRLPLVPPDIAEPGILVDAFRARREGGVLNEADRAILNAPAFARGWNEIARAVRHELSLSATLRELAICAVGMLNGAPYEVEKHAPVFLAAGGRQEQLDALSDIDAAAGNGTLFSVTERAALCLAIEMTRNVKVSDATYGAIAEALDNRTHLVELIGTIAMYNMVSRVLVALDIG